MDASNELMLELDASLHQDFVLASIQSLRMSDCNLLISCLDGGTVFTNKRYLGVFSKVVKDVCKDFPEQEKLTLQVEFSKNHVDLMMEYFETGELRSADAEELNEVVKLIQCLGVSIENVELIELMAPENPTLKRKSDTKPSTGSKTKKKYMTKKMKVTVKEERNIEDATLEEQSVEMEKPYECKECGNRFKTKSILYNHGGVHNPIKCESCDKTFAQKASLKLHMTNVHASSQNC